MVKTTMATLRELLEEANDQRPGRAHENVPRRHAEHRLERVTEMSRTREARHQRRVSQRRSLSDVIHRVAKTRPIPKTAQRNTNLMQEQVPQAAWRQIDRVSKFAQRQF